MRVCKEKIVKIVFGKRIKLSFFCQAKDNTHTHSSGKAPQMQNPKYRKKKWRKVRENEENAAGEDIWKSKRKFSAFVCPQDSSFHCKLCLAPSIYIYIYIYVDIYICI